MQSGPSPASRGDLKPKMHRASTTLSSTRKHVLYVVTRRDFSAELPQHSVTVVAVILAYILV